MMNILGINAYHADVSAVLVRDGKLVAAVEEERFARIKHVAGFPEQAIRRCLEMGEVGPEQIDHFAVSRNPKANLGKKAWYVLTHRPSLGIIRRRAGNQGLVAQLPGKVAEALGLDSGHVRERFHWVEHHPAHLASAFFVSPFQNAAVCAIDGFGDFVSTSFAMGRMNSLEHLDRVYFPHSLGIFYLALTQYLGFPGYGDEFKVMGLAPYGEPDFAARLRKLVHLKEEGLFELDLSYFQHWSRGDDMSFEGGVPRIGLVYTPKLEELMGPARRPGDDLLPRHEAIAASLQVVFEEAVFHLLHALYRKTRLHNLCLAGGCAMNSVANGKIRANTPFEQVYVQPAASDNGTALGAAFHVWNQELRRSRGFVMGHALWGPRFADEEIEEALGLRKSESRKSKSEDNSDPGKGGSGKAEGGSETAFQAGEEDLGLGTLDLGPEEVESRQSSSESSGARRGKAESEDNVQRSTFNVQQQRTALGTGHSALGRDSKPENRDSELLENKAQASLRTPKGEESGNGPQGGPGNPEEATAREEREAGDGPRATGNVQPSTFDVQPELSTGHGQRARAQRPKPRADSRQMSLFGDPGPSSLDPGFEQGGSGKAEGGSESDLRPSSLDPGQKPTEPSATASGQKQQSGKRKAESENNVQRSTFNVQLESGHEPRVEETPRDEGQRTTVCIEKYEDDESLCRRTAEAIADGLVVGWFQGRMEWGARALGNRSIVADARRKDMRDIINTKIKFREKFRPFAPSILEEAIHEYFEGAVPDPFMIQVYPVREEMREVIPAVTHVDGSGRLQSVNRTQNPLYWLLIKSFEELTGVPVVLNTSFNENEPIVHRPEEALDCFLRTDMDVLVMGRYFVSKAKA